MPNYSYLTFPSAIAALQARLYGSQFWGMAELQGYLIEALRTWNAYTGFWRDSFSFPLQQNVTWYDLAKQANTLIPYTVGQYDLITQIENHLLEPPTPNAWSGSLQYAISDLLFALQRRQDETLGTSGCTLAATLVNAPLGGRITLADNVIDIRRVAWLPNTGLGFKNKILRQVDPWVERAFNPRYLTQAASPPTTWLQNAEPPPSFDVDSVPPVAGQYDVLTVNAGPAWIAGTNSALNIPDDWTWLPKWGAMMDLFDREGNAKDNLRARYCEQRFTQGLALLENTPTVLALRINTKPVAVDAIRNGDDFNPLWQAAMPAAPTQAYATGNLLAFTPIPNSSSAYTATVTVSQNALVDTSQPIQAPRDVLEVILGYAQHLSVLKMGGAEFMATMPLYQNFIREASLYNGKLSEMGIFEKSMQDLSQLEEQRNPRYAVGTAPTGS